MNLQGLVEGILGQAISNQEYVSCLAMAQRKLKGIIEREGDSNGTRQDPYYLALLVAETVGLQRMTLISLEEGCVKEKAHRPNHEACAHKNNLPLYCSTKGQITQYGGKIRESK